MPSPSLPNLTGSGQGPEGGSKRLRALVAEDDPDMRSLVVELFLSSGWTVEAVSDGAGLLAALTERASRGFGAVDLIVSDIRMPVTSGLQVVEALRRAHCWTPVILMTAFGDADARRNAERQGAVLFDKPFDLDDLMTVAAELVAPKRK